MGKLRERGRWTRWTKRGFLLLAVVLCLGGLTAHVSHRAQGHIADQSGFAALQACRAAIRERLPGALTFGTPEVSRPASFYLVRTAVRPTEADNDSGLHWFECRADLDRDDVMAVFALVELPITNRVLRW